MYQHIMVPVDGSKLAECVLPHVATITGGCQVSKVTFARVVKPFHLYHGEEYRIPKKERQRLEADSINIARSYLEQLTAPLKYNGSLIQYQVLLGNVAETLTDFASKNGVDLIIISTHGHSGVSRWFLGSVAERVLRSASVPVLMVRAPGCTPGN